MCQNPRTELMFVIQWNFSTYLLMHHHVTLQIVQPIKFPTTHLAVEFLVRVVILLVHIEISSLEEGLVTNVARVSPLVARQMRLFVFRQRRFLQESSTAIDARQWPRLRIVLGQMTSQRRWSRKTLSAFEASERTIADVSFSMTCQSILVRVSEISKNTRNELFHRSKNLHFVTQLFHRYFSIHFLIFNQINPP